ncbi:MAG: AGE family epimerase/isomerase [Pseudomonadota bacterium]
MSTSALYRRAREAKAWLTSACFPLWRAEGVDGGLFREALDLQARASDGDTTRVRVQARQAYVYCEAARLGWEPEAAETLAALGLDALLEQARRPDGLFGRRLHADGSGLAEETADLYDTAFCLHAFAHAAMQFPNLRARCQTAADATLAAVDKELADPTGGYAEAKPRPAHRLQNPHMHFLESCLALHAAFPDKGHLDRALAIKALARERFIDPETGALLEYFEPDWRRAEGDKGDVVEPGHQFEWVWLLDRCAAMAGEALAPEAERLYEIGVRSLDEDGRAIMAINRAGDVVDGSRRTWVQTEALKAHLAMWARGDETAGARAMQAFDVLMDEYLTPEGGWIDHYDADGGVLAADMPASTGYHVVLALAELIDRTTG